MTEPFVPYAQPRAISAVELPESARMPASVNPLAEGVFMKHQRQWLEDRSPLKICEKGRRTGITFAAAWDDTLTAAASRSAGGGNCFYIGDTKDKGLEYIGYVAHFARCIGEELAGLEEYLFEDRLDDGSTRYITAYRARFASGFRVEALSSRPANIRGLQGRVTIDEAAFHQNVRAVIAAANALLIWGGAVRIISTHNGASNPFNRLVIEARAGRSPFKVHRYTFDDAVANGLYERVKLKAPTVPPKKEWYAQIRGSYGTDKDAEHEELDAIPSQGEGAWLSYDLIATCEHADAGKPDLYRGAPSYLGNDIGRKRDLWVGWGLEPVGDVLWTREAKILDRATFATQEKEFNRMMVAYRVARACMDQTGMGMKPVEDAQRKWGELRVEGVMFTAPIKLVLATGLKQAFEDRKIRVPIDEAVRNDLHSVKKLSGPTGAPRFVVEDDDDDEATQAEGHSHADRFWAAALAVNAAAHPTLIEFLSSGIRRGSTELGGFAPRRVTRGELWQ